MTLFIYKRIIYLVLRIVNSILRFLSYNIRKKKPQHGLSLPKAGSYCGFHIRLFVVTSEEIQSCSRISATETVDAPAFTSVQGQSFVRVSISTCPLFSSVVSSHFAPVIEGFQAYAWLFLITPLLSGTAINSLQPYPVGPPW